jgi:hypothetical protein
MTVKLPLLPLMEKAASPDRKPARRYPGWFVTTSGDLQGVEVENDPFLASPSDVSFRTP